MRQKLALTILGLALAQGAFAQQGVLVPNQTGAPARASQPDGQAGAAGSPELARMRDDLNKLESLNLNMSSEVEFLHDQNLQILLRTNVQMWTILIRDMRDQIAREEQRQASPAPPR